MTIFFLLIGLELEREIYEGELSNIKNAILPIIAALGGMMFPAAIFFMFNYGSITQDGTGIPTATDIAFALGILSLLGKRVPGSLKIFLTALAVIDDLGAIIIIAIFYSSSISWMNLLIAFGIYAILIVMNRMKNCNSIPYLIGGLFMWYFMLNSGVHPTITGVLLAFAIPFGKSKETSPSYKIQHILHKPVAFFILPLFAMANTGIVINQNWHADLLQVGSLGIIAGLVLGKPLGITLISYLGVKLKIAKLPEELKWSNIIGVGFLAGIGFTMSIFITLLAFDDLSLVNSSKIAILAGSIIAGIIGFAFLNKNLKSKHIEE
jgi:NhaA family Na+:H+ antiporter